MYITTIDIPHSSNISTLIKSYRKQLKLLKKVRVRTPSASYKTRKKLKLRILVADGFSNIGLFKSRGESFKIHRLVRKLIYNKLSSRYLVTYLNPHDIYSKRCARTRRLMEVLKNSDTLIVNLAGVDGSSNVNIESITKYVCMLQDVFMSGRLLLLIPEYLNKLYLLKLGYRDIVKDILFHKTLLMQINDTNENSLLAAINKSLQQGRGFVLKLPFGSCSTSVFIGLKNDKDTRKRAISWLSTMATTFKRTQFLIQRYFPHQIEVRVLIVHGKVTSILGTKHDDPVNNVLDGSMAWFSKKEMISDKNLNYELVLLLRQEYVPRVMAALKHAKGLSSIDEQPWLRLDFLVDKEMKIIFSEFEMGSAQIGDSSTKELIKMQQQNIKKLADIIVTSATSFAKRYDKS